MAQVLKGGKVVLRGKRLDDAANDYAWRCDEELARLDAAPPLRLSFAEFLAEYAEELRYPSPRRRRFAIESPEGKHIGNLMYYDIDEGKGEAELGIMMGDRDYWDQGYGTDAIATLLDHIFNTTSLERIYLNTLDWNIRAQRCFEKSGFVPCGQVRRYGNNFIVMEICRSSSKKKQEGLPFLLLLKLALKALYSFGGCGGDGFTKPAASVLGMRSQSSSTVQIPSLTMDRKFPGSE